MKMSKQKLTWDMIHDYRLFSYFDLSLTQKSMKFEIVMVSVMVNRK